MEYNPGSGSKFYVFGSTTLVLMNSAEDNLTYLGGRINVAVGDNGDVGVGSLSHGLWKEILVNI